MKNVQKPLAVRIMVTALTFAALMVSVFLIFGEIDENAALCRWVGWGIAQTVCIIGGILLISGSFILWKWSRGLTWEDLEG